MALTNRKRRILMAAAVAMSGGGTVPLLPLDDYAFVHSTYMVYPTADVLWQACQVGAGANPSTKIDIRRVPGSNAPDVSEAIATFGTTFEIYKYVSQNNNGVDGVSMDPARRHRVITTDAGLIAGITYDLGGNFYNLPDTLTVDRQGFSVAQVMIERGINVSGHCTLSFGNGGTGANNAYLGSSIGIQLASTSLRNFRRAPLDRPFYKAATSGPTGVRFWRNDDEGPAIVQGTLGTAGTITGGAITGLRNGNSIVSTVLTSKSLHLMSVALAREAVPVTMQAIRDAAFKIFNIRRDYNRLAMMIGDSIFHGQGCSDAKNWVYYNGLNLANPDVAFANFSTPARRMSDQLPTRVDFTNNYEAGKVNHFLLQSGINDIKAGTSGSDLFTNVCQPFVTGLKSVLSARGAVWTLQKCDGTAGFTAQMEIERQAYNDLLRNNAASMGVLLVDRSANPNMQDSSDLTKFLGDKLHNTSLGYQTQAAYESPILDPWFKAA